MYNIDDFVLNDVYVNENTETTTYCFDCPLSFLEKHVDLAQYECDEFVDYNLIKGEISLETSLTGDEIYQPEISPVVEYNDGDESSIDWFDIDLDDDFINALLDSVRTITKEN